MNGQPYNIATGKSIDLFELIKKLKTEFPEYDKAPNIMPARDGDIKHSCADISRYKELGF